MTENTYARICVGGRDMDLEKPDDGPYGRCPGVVEEALFSCLADKPLYISAFLGGVSEKIVHAFQGDDANFTFKLPTNVTTEYQNAKPALKPDVNIMGKTADLNELFHYDGPLNTDEIVDIFRHYGLKRLSKNNGLSPAENRHLFQAGTITELIGWILTGLARLQFPKKTP